MFINVYSQFHIAKQLSEVFGVHINTIWRWVDQDRFPKPVRVSRKIVRFRAEDVQEFLNYTRKKKFSILLYLTVNIYLFNIETYIC